MTIKEVFKMVESYNTVSEMMGTRKIKAILVFVDNDMAFTEGYFTDYKSFRGFVRKNYFPNLVTAILNCENWDFNNGGNYTEDVELVWGWNNENISKFRIELTFD